MASQPATNARAIHYPWTNPAYCAVCNRRLTVHEAATGRVCSDVSCRSTQLRRDIEERMARQRAALNKAAERCSTHLVRKHGIDNPGQVAHARVPANLLDLRNLPERRRRRFRDRLQKAVSDAAAALASDRDVETRFPHAEPSPMSSSEQELLGHACATCRGACCQVGHEHAFIDEALILRYMRDHPGVRPRQVLNAYLSRIGARTFDGSCVYHGAKGCTLPRSMRADICNRFLCLGLKALLESLQKHGDRRAYVMASTDTTPTRAAIFGPGFRHECDAGEVERAEAEGGSA